MKKIRISFLVMLIASTIGTFAQLTPQQRAAPIVMKGGQLLTVISRTKNYNASELVGYRYNAATSQFVQIPIQVDEKSDSYTSGTFLDGAKIFNFYGQNSTSEFDGFPKNVDYSTYIGDHPFSCPDSSHMALYCDPNTWMGADYNPKFDFDDELSVMARDLGVALAPALTNYPPNTISGTGSLITIQTDPNNINSKLYLYIFCRANTNINQAANAIPYVNYSYKLLRDPNTASHLNNQSISSPIYMSDYRSFFNTDYGPNPEQSRVITPYYTEGFSDRWIEDFLQINSNGISPANLLYRADVYLAFNPKFPHNDPPDYCGRTVLTFSQGQHDPTNVCYNALHGEGAFIANISGPIRAIRSFIGANSGIYTQRDYFYYDQIEINKNYLRVHPISGSCSSYNYNASAGVMKYYNNNNKTGIDIDGNVDLFKDGQVDWEYIASTVSPSHGAIYRQHTNTGYTGSNIIYTSYYSDNNSSPKRSLCTAATQGEWGSSGLMFYAANPTYDGNGNINGANIDVTDARGSSPHNNLVSTEANVYLNPADISGPDIETATASWRSLLSSIITPVAIVSNMTF